MSKLTKWYCRKFQYISKVSYEMKAIIKLENVYFCCQV